MILNSSCSGYPRFTLDIAFNNRENPLTRYSCIGYHYVIMPDGAIEKGREETAIGAHCKGHNKASIGICYIDGVDMNGKPKDTRTPEQKEALKRLVAEICNRHPDRNMYTARPERLRKSSSMFVLTAMPRLQVKDHLGNNRVVLNQNGSTVERLTSCTFCFFEEKIRNLRRFKMKNELTPLNKEKNDKKCIANSKSCLSAKAS